jgi:MFS family permease
LFALVSLMGMPFVVLMPIFAARVLHGGPHTLGFLMGAMGVGALVSALSLAARRSVRGLVRMIPMAAAVFGLGLIGFGASRVFWLSMITVMVAGMGMMMGMAASNTVIQTIVSEDNGVHGHGAVRQPAGRSHGEWGGRSLGRTFVANVVAPAGWTHCQWRGRSVDSYRKRVRAGGGRRMVHDQVA